MHWNRRIVTGLTGLLCAAVMLSITAACARSTAQENAPANTPAGNDAKPDEAKAKAAELARKAWTYLEPLYNKKGGRNPMEDGWGPECNAGFTGFVVLGAVKCGLMKYDDQRVKDSAFKMMTQQQASGAFDFGGGQRAVYVTSIVVSCLSQLRDHGGDTYKGKFDDVLKKASNYLKSAQVGNAGGPLKESTADKDSNYGGWAYSAEELADKANAGKPRANLSTSAYAIDAIAAFGLEKGDPLWKAAITFLERNHNAGEVKKNVEIRDAKGNAVIDPKSDDTRNAGGARYAPSESKAGEEDAGEGNVVLRSYGSMTYALLRCYLLAGLDRKDERVQLAYRWITRNFDASKVSGFVNTPSERTADQQGYYYQAHQMAATLTLFGETTFEDAKGLKRDWRKELLDELAKRQKDNGSWVNDQNPRWNEDLAILTTGYAIGALGDMIGVK